jgi:hypothetical protein
VIPLISMTGSLSRLPSLAGSRSHVFSALQLIPSGLPSPSDRLSRQSAADRNAFVADER